MEVLDDIPPELECGVCMEVYKEPKTLPCIHSFCRICIARHIISLRQEHTRTKGFLCPLCRFYIRVPRPDQPIEQWANQMPNNTQIPYIIEAWRKRVTMVNIMCQYHPEENLTSYCSVCKCVACSKCLGERHPSCTGDAFCSVREVADKRKHEMQNGLKELNEEAKRMTDTVDLVKTVMSGLKEAEGQLVADIKEHAQLCIKHVTKVEAELLDKLDSAVETQLKCIRLSKNPVDEAADMLRHYKEEIDNLMKSSNGLNFMDNVELAKERHRECMERIQQLQSQCRPPAITFVESETSAPPSIGTLVSPVSDLESDNPSQTLAESSSDHAQAHSTYM